MDPTPRSASDSKNDLSARNALPEKQAKSIPEQKNKKGSSQDEPFGVIDLSEGEGT